MSAAEAASAHPQEPRSGCGAAIVRDGRLLLLQRLREPEAFHWGLPGGKIDWLETVEHAVRREIAEETGLVLGATSLLCVVDQIDATAGEHWIAPVLLALDVPGEPRLLEPEKHGGLGWFAPDALPESLAASAQAAAAELRARGLF